jgi:hypothetical protein
VVLVKLGNCDIERLNDPEYGGVRDGLLNIKVPGPMNSRLRSDKGIEFDLERGHDAPTAPLGLP